jgi:PAP_fibrillin
MKKHAIALVVASSLTFPGHAFLADSMGARKFPSLHGPRVLVSLASSSTDDDSTTTTAPFVEAVPMLSSVTDPEAIRLREELINLAEITNKGFSSTPSQKKRAREIILQLAKYNPTAEPAFPYYKNDAVTATPSGVSLAGKWNLIYTDAPDITSLDTSRNPFATAKLGRIGQECNPPFIYNVIEWKRPDWADPLPFAGDSESRILQKVCLQATATPDQPTKVNLQVAGIDLIAPPSSSNGNENNGSNGKNGLQQAIEAEGLAVGLLRNNPLELRGPGTVPFGQFEILYLDEEMRIIRTGQNYVAVNVRSTDEWF